MKGPAPAPLLIFAYTGAQISRQERQRLSTISVASRVRLTTLSQPQKVHQSIPSTKNLDLGDCYFYFPLIIILTL